MNVKPCDPWTSRLAEDSRASRHHKRFDNDVNLVKSVPVKAENHHYPLVNLQKTYRKLEKSQFLMGNLTISMAIFNTFLYV